MHSLGHSYASLILGKDVPITVVSERMGHANQDTRRQQCRREGLEDTMKDVIANSRKPAPARMSGLVTEDTLKRGNAGNKRVKWRGRRGSNPRPPT
jgi:hypothetical protein